MGVPNFTYEECQRIESGAYGVDYIADTDSRDGFWGKIVVVTAATFNVLTENQSGIIGTKTAVAFAAGTVLHGDFRTIDLTSGTIFAYRSK